MNKKQKNIAIIGAGRIGTALEYILKKKGITPIVWDRNPKKLKKVISFSQAINNSHIIFLCVPSWVNRQMTRNIYMNLKDKGKIIITLSKGIEDTSLKTMEIVLKEELKAKADYGILVGPMMAEEIKEGHPTMGIIGISNTKWKKDITKLFHKTNLKLKFSQDLHGIALCSVLKNTYSVILGMADGYGFGMNTKSLLTIEIYNEMKDILKILGGKKETSEGLAGLGDVLATGWSHLSYNFNTGRNIVLKNDTNFQSEGCLAVTSIAKLLGKNLKKYTILSLMKKIIIDKKKIEKTFFTVDIFENI